MNQSILSLTICLTLLVGCKYEEGPVISLKSKKARLENTWQVEQARSNGNDVTDSYDNYTLKLSKDGDAELTATYNFGDFSYSGDTQGTWEFKNEKENISLDFEDDNADGAYQILKLTSNELWLREVGQDLELRLK